MGTNYYLRRVEPRFTHDLMHIAKLSAGWIVHFQDSTDGYADPHDDIPEPPDFHSIADIRRLLESGEWQIADEYGETWAPGDASLEEFDDICRWRGGPRFEDNPVGSYPDGEPPYESLMPNSYRDPDGYVFTRTWFR